MSVQGKDIFSFNSTGYAGDIVFSSADLTVEHPEFLKLDGATYKRANYPQIEKNFTNLYTKPTGASVRMRTFSIDHYSTSYQSYFLIAKYKNDIAIIGIKYYSGSYSDITTYISHDDGLTFETNTVKRASLSSEYYGMTTAIIGDTIYIFHTNTTSYSSSGKAAFICSTDGGKTWKAGIINHAENVLYQRMSLKVYSFAGKFILYFYCGKATILTKDPTNKEQSLTDWDEMDITGVNSNPGIMAEVKNGNKFIIGGMFNGPYRVLNEDYTYTDGDDVGITNSSYFNQSAVFYDEDAKEYVSISTSSTQADCYVSRSKDLFTWTQENMKAPEAGQESSNYNFLIGKLYGSLVFQYSSNNGTIMCRDLKKYSKIGNTGNGGSRLNTDIHFEPGTNLPYIICVNSSSTTDHYDLNIDKVYLIDVSQYFTLPSCKKFASVFSGGGIVEDQLPFIRSE